MPGGSSITLVTDRATVVILNVVIAKFGAAVTGAAAATLDNARYSTLIRRIAGG